MCGLFFLDCYGQRRGRNSQHFKVFFTEQGRSTREVFSAPSAQVQREGSSQSGGEREGLAAPCRPLLECPDEIDVSREASTLASPLPFLRSSAICPRDRFAFSVPQTYLGDRTAEEVRKQSRNRKGYGDMVLVKTKKRTPEDEASTQQGEADRSSGEGKRHYSEDTTHYRETSVHHGEAKMNRSKVTVRRRQVSIDHGE